MIHPTAIIAPGAVIGGGVTIGPFCQIGEDVVIEQGVSLEAHVILQGRVYLETGVRLFSYVKIGNGHGRVRIGARTHLREFCLVGTQNDSDRPVSVAADNFIMAYVQLFPGTQLGANCVLTNAVTLYENSRCEERVIIGGLSGIAEGCTIGTGVMVGGASNIAFDMPPFCLVEGNPAVVRGLNLIGMRRRFEARSDIESVKRCFKRLRHGFNEREAAELIETTENPQAGRFVAFVASHICH